jgi:hypothetical protein
LLTLVVDPTFWQFDSIAQVAASAVALTPMALAALAACEPQSCANIML